MNYAMKIWNFPLRMVWLPLIPAPIMKKEEEGRKYIKENILHNRETLPIGEFAIGTNTTAYVMGRKFGIEAKLPILIAEKDRTAFCSW